MIMGSEKISIFRECRKLGLPFWQWPPFLFSVMAFITILHTLLVASLFVITPQAGALILIFTAILLLFFGGLIILSFNKIVEANRLESELKSIATHQLRTPVTKFKWMLEALEEETTKLPQDFRDNLSELHNPIEKMVRMIDFFLTLDYIESGKVSLNKQIFSLSDFTKGTIDNFRTLAEDLNVKLIFKSTAFLPEVLADKERILIVIQNFIDNAVRYTHKKGKGGKVIIEIKKMKGPYLIWSITDEGIGIPEKQQKYIFRKFFRAKNVKESIGSGIGLYIAKSIVELSNGKIGFESKEGKGSKFWFTLPIAKLLSKHV